MKRTFGVLAITGLCIIALATVAGSAIIDTYIEDFDGRGDDVTIDGVDNWSVDQGIAANAITQDSTTYTGSGNALQLTGTAPEVALSRTTDYDAISTCWVEFITMPGTGAQARDLPSGKIAAVSFDYTGKVLASDGTSWTDTGETFTEGEWYRIMLKLNFTDRLYDIYIQPVAVPETEFIPDKENLNFIDSSISSVNEIGFGGVYNTTRTDETYIDDLIIHFIDRLEVITPLQTLMEEQASNAITVQLQNANSEPQTAWQDTALELQSSSSRGEFSLDKDNWMPVTQVIVTETAQQATFYYKDFKTGKPIITVKEYPDRGWDEASQQFTIVAEPTQFDVVTTTPQVAGEEFTVEITAKDEDGGVNEFYSGEVEILLRYVSPLTGTKGISPETATGFNKGRLQISAQYPDCGIVEIVVQDTQDSSRAGVSGEIIFLPASFGVSAGSPQVVNREFELTMTALNGQGEACPNYQGPAGLSVVAVSPEETSGEMSPSTLNQGEFSGGIAENEVSFNRWGTVEIEAHDVNYPDQAGVSDEIEFWPSDLLIEVEPPSPERDFYYVGEPIDITISLIDELKAAIPDYQGLIKLDYTMGLSLPEEYQFEETDEGVHTFTTNVSSAGSYEVSAEDEASGLTGRSGKIEVKGATLEVISTVSPVGTTEVIIQLVDEDGNLIASENELFVEVILEEEDANNSAISSTFQTPVSFQNGVARILVSNTQAEIVTISPSSAYDFKVKKGTVTFGRMAKTGIGALMWREIKDRKHYPDVPPRESKE